MSRDQIPRRCRMDKMSQAELAIMAAKSAVESAGADVLLTDAIVLLGKAQEKVADFVDKPDHRKYPIKLEHANKDRYGEPLLCSGCAHSAAGEPFPGRPSGERPCCFCLRNVERHRLVGEHAKECKGAQNIDGKIVDCRHPAHGLWYDGSKCVTSPLPMDCYSSNDMSRQMHIWRGGSPDDVLIG